MKAFVSMYLQRLQTIKAFPMSNLGMYLFGHEGLDPFQQNRSDTQIGSDMEFWD